MLKLVVIDNPLLNCDLMMIAKIKPFQL